MDEVEILQAECQAFTRYLIDVDPDVYINSRYAAALEQRRRELAARSRFDRLLLSLGRKHPILTRAVDVYSRFFAPASALRRRLIMLLAIIECNAPTAARLEQPDHAGMAGFIIGMTWRSVLLAVMLLLTTLTLLPVQLLFGRQPGGEGKS